MATSLAAAIEAAHPNASVDKQPGGKGDFIVKADGRELWNKRAHPEEQRAKANNTAKQLAAPKE